MILMPPLKSSVKILVPIRHTLIFTLPTLTSVNKDKLLKFIIATQQLVKMLKPQLTSQLILMEMTST